MYRFTSKKNWESRIVILQSTEKLLVADKNKEIRRAIAMDSIKQMRIVQHAEGNAAIFIIDGEHDLVLRHHEECPGNFRLTHLAALIQDFHPELQILVEDARQSTRKLKEVLAKMCDLVKPKSFLNPAQEVAMVRQGSMSSRTPKSFPQPTSSDNFSPDGQPPAGGEL
jgi:hypothetical protein